MIDISAHGMELEVKEASKIVVRIIFIGLLRIRLNLDLGKLSVISGNHRQRGVSVSRVECELCCFKSRNLVVLWWRVARRLDKRNNSQVDTSKRGPINARRTRIYTCHWRMNGLFPTV
jgi:hypothetical protein